MSSIISEKVFERKYTKLKAFASYAFRYAIYLAVVFGVMLSFAYSLRVDDPLKFTMRYWVIFFVLCVVGTLVKMIQEKDVNVAVLSKTVDITIGDKNFVYQVKDYIGTNIKRGGKKNARYELVFAENPKDPDANPNITIPGINIRQFMEISDAVMTAKQELDGKKYEAFQGEVYERKRRSSVDLKFGFLTFMVVLVTVCIILYVLSYLFSSDKDLAVFVWIMTLLTLFYISRLVSFFRYLPVKEPVSKSLKSLRFESMGLNINNKSYSYKEIESVTMTPPYLTGFPRYHRILSVKLYEAKKPMRFSIGKRNRNTESEADLAAGCTCTYPALYERIKSEKALERKFKI